MKKVAESPESYSGQTVTVHGEVDDLEDLRAFKLESSNNLLGVGQSQALVVSRSPVTLTDRALGEDDRVIVSGTLHEFDAAEMESALGWDLEPLQRKYADLPVIIAQRVFHADDPETHWKESL